MRCSVKLEDIYTINEIEGVWTNEDYIQLLDMMNFPDADKMPQSELQDMLFMAINDFKPHKAAEILLTYKFSNILTKGQIENLANEMIDGSINEEFADISLHYDLFNVNRLLYNAFNGKFPNSKVSIVTFFIKFHQVEKVKITKSILLKAISIGLNENNLIKRIFIKQIAGKVKFIEAEHIIWSFEQLENGAVSIMISDHWINEDDFTASEFEGNINEFEEK